MQPAYIMAIKGDNTPSSLSMPEMATPTKYKDLETDGVMRRTTAEEYPQGRLLGEPKATRALLQFLASTSVALPRALLQQMAQRARRNDEWGLEALEEAIRTEG